MPHLGLKYHKHGVGPGLLITVYKTIKRKADDLQKIQQAKTSWGMKVLGWGGSNDRTLK